MLETGKCHGNIDASCEEFGSNTIKLFRKSVRAQVTAAASNRLCSSRCNDLWMVKLLEIR